MGLINAKKMLPFGLVAVGGLDFGAETMAATSADESTQTEAKWLREAEALEIDGRRVASTVDELGRTWWGVADFIAALNARPGAKPKSSRGSVALHRYMREGTASREVLLRHSQAKRMPGARGRPSPAMKAYGLLRLLRVMRFGRSVAVMRRVTDAQERLMGLDRE